MEKEKKSLVFNISDIKLINQMKSINAVQSINGVQMKKRLRYI